MSSVRIAGPKAPAVALAGHLYDLAVAIETAEEERIVVTWLLDGVPVDAGVLTGQGESACVAFRTQASFGWRSERRQRKSP